MYKLRYYCPDDAYWNAKTSSLFSWDRSERQHHEEVLSLLEQIRKAHSIDHELFPMRSPDGVVDEDDERSIYQEHIVPRAGVLIPRLEEKSVARAFPARQGRGYYHVARRVVVLEDGEVGWATGTESSRRRFLPVAPTNSYRPDELYFLEALLSQGLSLLSELCFAVGRGCARAALGRTLLHVWNTARELSTSRLASSTKASGSNLSVPR